MLPSLLPDDQRKSQEQATSTILVALLCFFLVMMMWTATPQKKVGDDGAVVDPVDQPVVPRDDANANGETPSNSEVATTGDAAADQSSPEPSLPEPSSPEPPPTFVTLGSLDQKSPYKMLVSLTHRGGTVSRIELASERYRDVQDLAGYLGQLIVEVDDWDAPCVVQVVGDGTPAARAGVVAGDEIVALDAFPIASIRNLRDALAASKPMKSVTLRVRRGGEEKTLTAELGYSPIDIVRPEITPLNYEAYRDLGGLRGYELGRSDPLSFRTTLASVDDARLDMLPFFGSGDYAKHDVPRNAKIDQELAGVAMLDASWELVAWSQSEATFRRRIPSRGIEMRKTFRLAKDSAQDATGSAYHLTLTVEVKNIGNESRRVAYQLDGPTGLPLEGAWYARKAGPGWGAYGIRDVVVRMRDGSPETVSENLVSHDDIRAPWASTPQYIGVDSIYFQCTFLPSSDSVLAQAFPIRVGMRVADWGILTDVSFRLISKDKTLAAGESFADEYRIFAGPKSQPILADYGLQSTLSYGWFSWIVAPLLAILHTFHALGMNYGMAIICLTIVVRLVMFPLSRKQVISAIKMQQIQPEMAAIAEKHKDDLAARQQAQAALFRKHNFNPLSGCLPLFFQLPIFVALYKSLSIDVELYGSPLFSKAFHWCTDLSAPDMLYNWSAFWASMGWNGFNTGQGMFYLGPFFNLLPLLTIGLFVAQQWAMMPPPTDEQQRLQRQMMNYMMIFFAFLFFKMPSGLCVYFIASSIWGIAERQLMPKPSPAGSGGEHATSSSQHEHHDERERERRKQQRERETKAKSSERAGGFIGWLQDIAEQAKKKGVHEKSQMTPHDNKRGKRKK
ncbi:MAG: YidC/Oxa1 family insertase periplasmic-domain containing protein [Thermoguttaceae bacterium]